MDGNEGAKRPCRSSVGWQGKDDAANDRNNLAVGRESRCNAAVLPSRPGLDLGGSCSRLVVYGVLYQSGSGRDVSR